MPPPSELLDVAIAAWEVDQDAFTRLMAVLLEQVEDVLPLAKQRLERAVEVLWIGGWSPADLVHVVGRHLTAGHAQLAVEHAVADGRRRVDRGQTLHGRWLDQLESLEEEPRSGGADLPEERLRCLVELLGFMYRLPKVAETVPRPGAAWNGEQIGAAAHLDPRMLAKVRALLAKAESTTFDDEAEAFTAKAQELIARHAIDEALLHTVDDVGAPSVRRMYLDDPYVDAKANLVGEVADANRCRVVFAPDLGWVTAFGYEHDLDAVELLSASLLTQATTAMIRQGPRRDASGRSRTRSFRRAFLLGFAQRIGERLRQATDWQMSATDDHAGRLVPVLAAREDRVEAAQRDAFPELVSQAMSASNATGWSAGRAAAEVARLEVSPHHLTDR